MKPAALFLILLLVLLVPADVRADIDGFKGMRWGSALADLQQTQKLTLTKDGGKNGTSLYVLTTNDLRFGKATLSTIHCSFVKKRLQGVMLLFSGVQNFAAVKEEAFAVFGKSAKNNQNSEEIHNWSGKVTTVVLSYNRNNQSGFLFIKAKKMPPLSTKRDPAVPAKQQTAMVPAGQPSHRPETRSPAAPATRPADLETALDRAPPLAQQPGQTQGFTPEIQTLVSRDQTLTHLCLETTGPTADAACVQMRENVERLEKSGLCMQPGPPDTSSPSPIVWRRCTPDADTGQPAQVMNAPEPGQNSLPTEPAQQQAVHQTVPTGGNTLKQCRLIGEFFASAAQMRDNGTEPQVAEQELTWQVHDQTPEITIERIRETVELVYFDQEYNAISGEALIQLVSSRCLSGSGPYVHPMP
jgi:hypothetical protein